MSMGPYLGVGNPLLEGPNDEYAAGKAEAMKISSCAVLGRQLTSKGHRGGGIAISALRSSRNGVIGVRQAPPLPETADELCHVAQAIGAAETDVMLGRRASKQSLKDMNDAQLLADYRVLHFATHGALAGEVTGATEPGLLLTPPALPTASDDGYLSTTDIAGLKLDADWVMLSACNTAAGGSDKSEAMSGLARAFFYAGARALLVSHWYVDSLATVTLIQGAIEELKSDPAPGRAGALQRSMHRLIDKGAPPSQWAPFVLVGEGSTR